MKHAAILILALLATLVALPGAADPAAGYPTVADLRVPFRAVPDSVSLVLFALESPRTLRIRSARTLSIDGTGQNPGGPVDVSVRNAALEIAGSRARRVTIMSGPLPMTLSAGERRRLTTGRIEITADGNALCIIARVPRRDYLAGALVSESDRRDPLAYLTALSVLQRNYATRHRGRHAPAADLCDNTHCQRYSLDGAAGAIYTAVDRGMGIDAGSGGTLPCYYSVNCGGATLTPQQVWKRPEAGYAAVTCRNCRGSRWYRWTRTVRSTGEVERVMGMAPVAPFVDDGFKILAGRALGFNIVLSNTVDRISRRGGIYHVQGRGFGHRVGLCQDGARELARNGHGALAILRHYFPRIVIGSRP